MPLLDWLNKDAATKAASKSDYRLLEEVPELSYGNEYNGNLLIQGDNLEALKALLPFYAGKVKCIFVDPPYNTKSAFEHYDDNLEHSIWLSTIYPRFELLRELLSEDGSIWVSIDDNESHYLKVMMDEIFGRRNFVQNIIWQKKFSPQNDAKYISDQHDHILCYAKHKPVFIVNKIVDKNKLNRAKNLDDDPRGEWNSVDYTCNKNRNERPNLYYAIMQPNTGEEIYPKETAVWRYSEERHKENVTNNLIYWGKKGTNLVPRFKKFPNEVEMGTVPVSLWLHQDVGNTQEARKESLQVNSQAPFSTPKPERLIKRILQISSNEGDLILDSFLGSATTSAVAHKMNRRHIGIELGEHAVTHCHPRLQSVIDGEQGGISKSVEWKGGGSFRFCKLGPTVFDQFGLLSSEIKFPTLAAHIWFVETRLPLTEKANSPLIGIHNGTGYYLLYNGILGDKRPQGGNVLTKKVLDGLPDFDGPKVIYGETTRLGETRLRQENITFKQIPYDVKAL